MKKFISHYWLYFISFLTSIISTCTLGYYFTINQILGDYDSIARLNIARKMVDSLTPGIGQLGGIWLPFPQVLMVPFIGNDFLWHTGLAGSFVSMIAFIFGAIYLYKLVFLLTKSEIASTLAWLCFVSNLNLLYLQVTPMSESFFLSCFIFILYFLIKWMMEKKITNLISLGVSMALITLTRYEGYFVFVAVLAIMIPLLLFYYKKEGKSKAEGLLVLYLTLASSGIALWLFYSAAIYGHPFYWLKLYSGTAALVPTNLAISAEVHEPITSLQNAKQAKTLLSSFHVYTWSIFLMNGVLTTTLALISFVCLNLIILFKLLTKKATKELPTITIVVITYIIFGLLIFGYKRGLIPLLELPAFSLETLLTRASNLVITSNIRYGLILAPIIAIFAGLIASKNLVLKMLVFIIIGAQIVSTFVGPYFLLFQLPIAKKYYVTEHAQWFKEHYDGGLVLISANRYEPFMLQVGIPYKSFIYEGSQQYWLDSLKNPTKYATWVVLNEGLVGDTVAKYLVDKNILKTKYNLEYESKTQGYKIYKRK